MTSCQCYQDLSTPQVSANQANLSVSHGLLPSQLNCPISPIQSNKVQSLLSNQKSCQIPKLKIAQKLCCLFANCHHQLSLHSCQLPLGQRHDHFKSRVKFVPNARPNNSIHLSILVPSFSPVKQTRPILKIVILF